MTTKSLGILTMFLLVATILTGCSFKIKNTDGLYLAYKDIDRAGAYASELKAMKNIPQEGFFGAKDKYTDATTSLNGYLAKAITDAADYEVNNTKEEYLATGGSGKVDAFENAVKLLRPKGVAVATIVSTVIPIAEAAIKAIMEANQKAKDNGLKVFTESVEKYKMQPFEKIPEGKVVKQGGK